MNYFFWFFLFLAVPIIVHLFNFRRAKKLFFTNVRFIRKISTETKSKTRLKHLMILSARMLTFLFLILAFIASFIKIDSEEVSIKNASESIYLDNSYSSMGDDSSDEAALVERIVSENESASTYLLTNNFKPFSNHPRTRNEILDELATLSTSYVNRSMDEVLNRIADDGRVWIISDFQDTDAESLTRIKEDSVRNYQLLFKEKENIRNVFIDSAWVEKDLENYSSNILKCTLGRTANFTEGTVVIKLLDENGNQISSVVKKLENQPEISFSLPPGSFFKLTLSGDDLEYDNEFFLTLDTIRIPRILILSSSYNRYLANIFSNEQLFDLILSRRDEIDYETISAVDLVVLNDFYQLPDGIVRQNVDRTTFLIIPSDSIDLANYESETGFSLRPDPDVDFRQIELNSGSRMMAGVYKRLNSSEAFPSARKMFDLSSIHDKIFLFRGGDTYLAGSVDQSLYFFTSPMRDDYTQLPNHAIFLPLMYRIAEESLESESRLFLYPNDYLEITELSSDRPPKIVSSNVEVIPEVVLRDRSSLVRIPVDLPPGFYHVMNGNDTIQSFGLNLPKSESQFEGPNLSEFSDFFADSPHVNVVSASENYEDVDLPSTDGNSLWKYALILALVFILVETLFHRFLK